MRTKVSRRVFVAGLGAATACTARIFALARLVVLVNPCHRV